MVIRRLSRWVALPALFGFLACQAFVKGDVPAYTCTGTDLAACPVGAYCKGAGCVPCEAVDVCDGFDNDCNGVVDDGPLSDQDGDGYTTCGVIDPESGAMKDRDCDDTNPEIHPYAAEVCNGIDDDCDGVKDNAGVACAETELCLPNSKSCVSKATACSVTGCTAPKTCDAETERCVDPPTFDLGAACSANTQCKSKICGDAAVLTLSFTDKSGSLCTKPCCTSADCPTDFACLGTGTGGHFCVPKDKLSRSKGGTKSAGSACAEGAECLSGLCTASRCVDTCCSDANCASGTSCRIVEVDGRMAFHCQATSGTKSNNAPCVSSDDCKSGFCYKYGDTTGRCMAPCCSTSSCPNVDLRNEFGDPDALYPGLCAGVTLRSASVRGTVLGCQGSPTVSATGKGLGQACTANSECRSTQCHASAKKCTDICCTDADCSHVGAGWTCRPTSFGNLTVLSCSPP